MATTTIKTTDMHCGSCKMLIEMTVNELDGVQSAETSRELETTVVEYDAAVVSPEEIAAAIRGAGHDAEIVA